MLLPVVWLLCLRGRPAAPIGGLDPRPADPISLYSRAWGARLTGEWPAWLVLIHYGSKAGPTLWLYLLAYRRMRADSSA